MSFLSNVIHFTGIPSQCYKEVNRNKMRFRLERKKKLSIFTDHMIIYIESMKNLPKSEVNRVARYKVNAQKSILCVYINNKQLKVKSKGTALFKIPS